MKRVIIQNKPEEDLLFAFKGPTFDIDTRSKGRVLSYKDGVVVSSGLSNAASGELVHILTKIKAKAATKSVEMADSDQEIQYEIHTTAGLIFNLNEDTVSICVIDPSIYGVMDGDEVIATGSRLSVRFNWEVLGRVINPLGHFLDKSPAVTRAERLKRFVKIRRQWKFITGQNVRVEVKAPGILLRQPVEKVW